MIKDKRDAKIEHQELTIRCLVEDLMLLKLELEEIKSERDAALENAILVKSDADAKNIAFNVPKFDLLEAQCQLKETSVLTNKLRQRTKDFSKEAHSILKQIEKKLYKTTKIHNFDNGKVTVETYPQMDNLLVSELQDLLNKLSSSIDNFAMETEKPFKKEFIKGIDTKTFIRNESRESLARSAIFAYAEQIGLKEQFAKNEPLMREAINNWFNRFYHEPELKKLTLLKAKSYMSPYNRAKTSVEYSIRKMKAEEYDFRET